MKTKLFLFFTALTFAFSSCKKEVGPVGPAGTAGANGNANVKAFIFNNPITNNWHWTGTLDGVTDMDSSLLLAYVEDATCVGLWYSVPGVGCFATYTSRLSSSKGGPGSTVIDLQLLNPDGSFTPHISASLSKLRIIIAPASSVTIGKREVDYNDYHAVCKYYGLQE